MVHSVSKYLLYPLQGDGKAEGEDPIDVHYKKIKTDMEVVDKSSDEFKMIEVCLVPNNYDSDIFPDISFVILSRGNVSMNSSLFAVVCEKHACGDALTIQSAN